MTSSIPLGRCETSLVGYMQGPTSMRKLLQTGMETSSQELLFGEALPHAGQDLMTILTLFIYQ